MHTRENLDIIKFGDCAFKTQPMLNFTRFEIDDRNSTPGFYSFSAGDNLDALGGNDLVSGADGNDTILGGDGNDTILGGSGNDSLFGGIGNDSIFGDIEVQGFAATSGNDTLYGDDGNDTLYGGYGDDKLYGDDLTGSLNLLGGDSLVGGPGDDVYYVNSKLDLVDEKPNEGNDRIVVQAPPGDPLFVFFNNKFPNNVIEKVSNFTDTINQYAVAELDDNLIVANLELEASAFNVANNLTQNNLAATHDWQIYSNRGNDTITGGDGNDSLYGGAGNDTVNGGIGRDSLFGGVGNDRILGDIGNDALFGGSGNDTLFGGSGTNNLQGFDINAPSATEVDILQHSSGSTNRFFLAAPDNNGIWTNGYKNGGNTDYALIKGFAPGDVLGVANTGSTGRFKVGSDIWVTDTTNGGAELIAIVEGITIPNSVTITTAAGIFSLP